MRDRSDAGMSIVEVLVAMTVFSVGILAIFQTTDASFDTATSTTHRARATAIATKAVEDARAMPYEKLAVTPSNVTVPATTETVGGSTFDVTRTVTTVPGVAYKQVNVLVQWTDAAGGHDLTQSTYVYPAASGTTTTTIGTQGLSVVPTLLTVANLDGSVRLTWDPPAPEQKVQRFIVERALKRATNSFATGPVWRVTSTEPPTSTGLLVTGLAASTGYVFRVGAVASNGSVVWSNALDATTSVSTSLDCKVSRAAVTPAMAITVETSGTCTGFTATYDSPTGGSPVTVPLVPDSLWTKVYSAQIDNSTSSTWQVGTYKVVITDSSSNVRGTAAFTICEGGISC